MQFVALDTDTQPVTIIVSTFVFVGLSPDPVLIPAVGYRERA